MSEEKHHNHVTSYKTYLGVLTILIALTFLSVAITQIELSRWAAAAALTLAGIKSTFVLLIFMHLKFELIPFIGVRLLLEVWLQLEILRYIVSCVSHVEFILEMFAL